MTAAADRQKEGRAGRKTLMGSQNTAKLTGQKIAEAHKVVNTENKFSAGKKIKNQHQNCEAMLANSNSK